VPFLPSHGFHLDIQISHDHRDKIFGLLAQQNNFEFRMQRVRWPESISARRLVRTLSRTQIGEHRTYPVQCVDLADLRAGPQGMPAHAYVLGHAQIRLNMASGGSAPSAIKRGDRHATGTSTFARMEA